MFRYRASTYFSCILAVPLFCCLVTNTSADEEYDAPGAHRVVQVENLLSRNEVVNGPGRWAYYALRAQGITDEQFVDGSLAVGRLVCCRPVIEDHYKTLFYVPPELDVNRRDFVEIRMGSIESDQQAGERILPLAIRVRERAYQLGSECKWGPKEMPGHLPSFVLVRSIHCEWMASEGWVSSEYWPRYWYKPSTGIDITDITKPVPVTAVDGNLESNLESTDFVDALGALPGAENFISVTQLDDPKSKIVSSEDSIFVLAGTNVVRLDGDSGEILNKFDVGNADMLLGYAADSFWTGKWALGILQRYDSQTGNLLATIELQGAPYSMTEHAGSAWLSTKQGLVQSVVLATNRIGTTIEIGETPGGMMHALNSVWVADQSQGITRISREGDTAWIKPRGCKSPTDFIVAGGQIWVMCTENGRIISVDPQKNGKGKTIKVGGEPFDPTTDGRRVWYRDVRGSDVFELDTETESFRTLLVTDGRVFGVKFAFGTLWVIDLGTDSLIRVRVGQQYGGK